MKRKAIYLSIACTTFAIGIILVSLWYFRHQEISFGCVGTGDGYVVGGGPAWFQEWKSSDGIMIYESMIGYSSKEAAQTALEEIVKNAVEIIERQKNLDNSSIIGERVVGMFAHPAYKGGRVSIIMLQKNDLYRVDAPSLEYAIAFEKYRGKEK
jgi:hypothetical protein